LTKEGNVSTLVTNLVLPKLKAGTDVRPPESEGIWKSLELKSTFQNEVKSYLHSVNQDLEAEEWKITCLRFAPNAPEQNPIEDVWLSAKRFVREFYSLCSSFAIAKRLFEFATEHQIFNFPKLSLYGSFS
jgi:hypothetical protein